MGSVRPRKSDGLICSVSWGLHEVVPRSTAIDGPSLSGTHESESTRSGRGREHGGERGGAVIVFGGVE